MNPPGSAFGKKWKMTTDKIEKARRPSMSGRYAASLAGRASVVLSWLGAMVSTKSTKNVP